MNLHESTPNGHEYMSGRSIRADFQKACAIAHGRGSGMSANELMQLVYEEGLPSREERERLLAAKLAEGAESQT